MSNGSNKTPGVGMQPNPGSQASWTGPSGSGTLDLDALPWGPTGNDVNFFFTTGQTAYFQQRYGGYPFQGGASLAGDYDENFWKNAAKLQDCFQKGCLPPGWQWKPGAPGAYNGVATQQEQYDSAATLPMSQGNPTCPGSFG